MYIDCKFTLKRATDTSPLYILFILLHFVLNNSKFYSLLTDLVAQLVVGVLDSGFDSHRGQMGVGYLGVST